jgi:hypothetical protein
LKELVYKYYSSADPFIGGCFCEDISSATLYDKKTAERDCDELYLHDTSIVKVNFYLKEIIIDFSLELSGNKNPLELYQKKFPTYESMKLATVECGIYSFEYGIKEVEE